MLPYWFVCLRVGFGALAVLLGVSAVWILAAELLRPGLAYFPTNSGQAQMFSAAQNSAAAAASVGMVRGDLWTAAAVTQAASLLFASPDEPPGTTSRAGIESARNSTERAAMSAPHDARNWLILAALNSPTHGENAVEALKLSYYTGSNEFALTPLRLSVAAGLDWDEDLQALVRQEIVRVLLERPNLKPAIATAYRTARPETRQWIESTLKEADPAFLGTLAGGSR